MAPPQLPRDAPVPATEQSTSQCAQWSPPGSTSAPLTRCGRTRAASSSGEKVGSAPGPQTPQPAGRRPSDGATRPAPTASLPRGSRAQKGPPKPPEDTSQPRLGHPASLLSCPVPSPLPQGHSLLAYNLTWAARSPISWQRTNHWLFSRYSTTSPERLKGRQLSPLLPQPCASAPATQDPPGCQVLSTENTAANEADRAHTLARGHRAHAMSPLGGSEVE